MNERKRVIQKKVHIEIETKRGRQTEVEIEKREGGR